VKVAVVERRDVPGFVGYVPDEIVVQFAQPVVAELDNAALSNGLTGISDLDQLGQEYGAVSVRPQFPGARPKKLKGQVIGLTGWHKIRFARHVAVEAVVNEYKNVPGLIDAQPIGIHTTSAYPNDGSFSNQWHMNQVNDSDIDAPEAWDIQTGEQNLIVAMLDTGVRYFHRDLGGSEASYENPTNVDGNMWINWIEKNGSGGSDDDNNGFVDDWIGWDFVDGGSACWAGEDCFDQDDDPRDFNGHGTHCAGNVAAITNNGYGSTGTAGGWGDGTLQPTANGVKVMALRIGWSADYFGEERGFVRMDFAAEAFYYAADNGARIASCSWGSSDTGGVGSAIDYFLASGGIVFKAAGNDGDASADYMCGRSDVISVAATDQDDCKADFSNYGPWVDVSAPGVSIMSLYHFHEHPSGDYVATASGTSMATPLAAGVSALIWSQNPSWTAIQVEQKLYGSSDDIYGFSCNSSYPDMLGAGRINAYNTVNTSPEAVPALSSVGLSLVAIGLALLGMLVCLKAKERPKRTSGGT
ncbi:MAG TPA: hypothetical protein EYP19_10140, partial [Desulfobacterales bacterium]|nr:hypothetical protein [Desulfobacterales bacterium]